MSITRNDKLSPSMIPLILIDQIRKDLRKQRKALSEYRHGLSGMESKLHRLSNNKRTKQWRGPKITVPALSTLGQEPVVDTKH
jgi:hypothetical protein